MKKLLLALSFCLASYYSYGQIRLSGTVTSADDKAAVPFSYVAILQLDSTVVESAVTDMSGSYDIQSLQQGNYIFIVESAGFETLSGVIDVRYPSIGDYLKKDFKINPVVESLEGAVVSASSVSRNANKINYLITDKQLLNKTDGLAVVLSLPDLYYDVVTQTLKPLSGSRLKILIDGVSASESDLRSLETRQIKSVDIYDFPPAKYSDYSRVIDVKTRYRTSGFYVGAGVQHAFTTGFGNDDIYTKYNWDDNQLSFSWILNHRKYSDVKLTNKYNYTLDQVPVNRLSDGNRVFGYDDNNFNLTYIHNVKDKYMIQTSFKPEVLRMNSCKNYDIQYGRDRLVSRQQTIVNDKFSFAPSFDIYSNIHFNSGNELYVNLVGTLFKADANNHNIEVQDGAMVFEDNASQYNIKNSTIADVEYTVNSQFVNFHFGTKIHSSSLSENVRNSFGEGEYKTKLFDNENYAQIDGAIGSKFSYSVIFEADYYSQNNNLQSYHTWMFNPSASISYTFSDKLYATAIYNRYKNNPTLSQLSNNCLYVTEDVIEQGNPSLHNSTLNEIAAGLSFHNNWLQLTGVVEYQHEKDPINAYYISENGKIVNRYENGYFKIKYGANLQALLSPFENNLLQLKFIGHFYRNDVSSEFIGSYSYTTVPIAYAVDFNYKHLTLSYTGNIPGYSESGSLLVSDEKISNLTASYNWKDFIFTASVIGFISGVYYTSKTINDKVLYYESSQNILDNRNMFTLGVRYHFNLGKSYKSGEKKMDNSDKDSGLF